jgi:2-alkenal reductase
MDITPGLAQTLNLPVKEGVMIAQVSSGGPAARAGLRGSQRRVRVGNFMVNVGGDIIQALDGQKITGVDDLTAFLDEQKKPGDDLPGDPAGRQGGNRAGAAGRAAGELNGRC